MALDATSLTEGVRPAGWRGRKRLLLTGTLVVVLAAAATGIVLGVTGGDSGINACSGYFQIAAPFAPTTGSVGRWSATRGVTAAQAKGFRDGFASSGHANLRQTGPATMDAIVTYYRLGQAPDDPNGDGLANFLNAESDASRQQVYLMDACADDGVTEAISARKAYGQPG